MGFPFHWIGGSRSFGSRKKEILRRPARGAIESLEQRILFAVQANTNVFDAVTPAGYAIPGAYAGQSETSNATFSMPGSSSNQVAVAYNDGAMLPYGQNANGSPMHQTGWAYSDDGGQSFSQPSTDPANPALLPTISDGTETTGDQANHVLAWDNENATLYMASTSFPNESDINVYASTDGGQTFTSVMDATPGAPTGTGNTIKYDKPWLAVDNNPGPNYGTVYLAYVQINNSPNTNTTEIFVTNLQPGPGKTWLPFSSESVLNTNGLGLVQSPEILVEPDDSVDVVFVGEGGGYGIYLDRSSSPTIQYGWNATPTRLVTFQNVSDYPFDAMDTDGHPTIAGIPAYPSVAIGTIPYGHTYLYMAYMDQNPDAIGQPNGPFSIYTLQYDLTTPPQAPITPSQVGQVGSVTNEWMPSLTLSPDGSYAFIGFYGGNGNYDPTTGKADEQYNTFYITGATNAGGIIWSTPTQITNVDNTGQPTGGYFDQPNGPKSGAQEWNPDYDSASADYQNFHYSFMETSNEQVYDSGGNPVTLDAQEDVYMANVPIPYSGTAPATPYGVTFTPNLSDGGTVQWNTSPYQNLNAKAYVEYSTDTQGWVQLPLPVSASSGAGFQVHIPNYSSGTTYYFRVRIQNVPVNSGGPDASSAYSDVVQSWTGGTPALDNALYSLWGYVNGQPQYRVTVAWPLGYDPSNTVQMQYYDGNRWTTQFQNADGSVTTLGGGSGDTGWAETFVITDSTYDPPAFSFNIFFQNSSGGRSAYSNALTAIDASNIDVPAAPSIDQPTSSDPSNPTNESGEVWVSWDGALYDQSAIMDVVMTPINDYGDYGSSVQTYAAYGDAIVEGGNSGVEYAIQIRVEKTEVYEGETITLTSDFSSPVYVIWI